MARGDEPVEERIVLPDDDTQLNAIVTRIAENGSRVLIERNGRVVAAIVPNRDYRRFVVWDEGWRERTAAIERISEAFMDVPLAELEAEVDRTVAKVRAERRAERNRSH